MLCQIELRAYAGMYGSCSSLAPRAGQAAGRGLGHAYCTCRRDAHLCRYAGTQEGERDGGVSPQPDLNR